ncbi:hypothetical protein B566_EDAN007697 [Ephemera danica]|nr:hypothetical protein B566_EDAN007697 [Ephemera danica]
MYSSIYRNIVRFSSVSQQNLSRTQYCKLCSSAILEHEHQLVEDKDELPVKKRAKRRNKTDVVINEIKSYLDFSDCKKYANSVPTRIIGKNLFPPEALYLVNPIVAGQVAEALKNYLLENNDSVPVFEMNPGMGLVSQELINAGVSKLNLFEPSMTFHPLLLEMLEKNQGKDVALKVDDLGNIAKLVYQDKVSNGNRVTTMLADVESRPWNDPCPVLRVVGTAPNKKFLRSLVFSIAFQTGLATRGRAEYYLIMHPKNYLQMTCKPRDEYQAYRYNSALFQVMYESQLLMKLPRNDFLPWEGIRNKQKAQRYKKLRSVDPDKLYLVRLVSNPKLLDLVPAENLQLMWYFFRVHLISKKKRVIPALEQWIPNCGPRLICQGLNIFTEFGDLHPDQMLKLFLLFSNWPEFPHCAFHTSLETSFLKSLAAEVDDDAEDEDEGAAPEKVD